MNRALFLFTIFMATISCKNSENTSDKVLSTNSQVKQQTQDIQPVQSTKNLTDSIQVKNIQVGSESPEEKIKFHASYPKTMYDFINKEEEDFVQPYFTEFKENAKDLVEGSTAGIDFGQHFELIENSSNFITFLIERYTSYGNNYNIQYFTHIYDIKDKRKLKFSDLFKSQDAFEKFSKLAHQKAIDIIQKKIDKFEGLTEEERLITLNDMKEISSQGTAATSENYHAFSWDKEGKLYIYFDKYQIATGNFGSSTITFSANEYKNLFDPQYKSLLQFNLEEEEDEAIDIANIEEPYIPESDIDCGKVPCVALTFDDGPSVYTNKLLDILKENNAKATFFVLGKSAKIQKNTILRTYKEGHQIGNHSWDHKDLKNLSKSNVAHQIYDTNDAVEDIIGEAPHLMRPPYGSMNSTVKELANMPIILWNLDPLDWKDRNADLVAERMSKANKNGIVLAHDIHKTTVNAIPTVIKALKNKGYHLVTVDQLFSGQQLKKGVKYSQRK